MATVDMSTGLIESPKTDLTKKANTVEATASEAPVTKWDITPDQTVESRVSGIIAQNSPLMQQAETSAKQYAATRGMGKSSMEAGAMQDAVIRAAMPIAQQDAQTAVQSNQFNSSAANTINLNNANQRTNVSQFNAGVANQAEANFTQAQNDLTKMAASFGYDANKMTAEQQNVLARMSQEFSQNTALANLDASNKIAYLNASFAGDKAMQVLKGEQAQALMETESKYKTTIQTSESAANFYSAITAAMAATQSTANMDAAQKTAAANYYNNALKNGLAILSYAGGGNGTDLTSLLKFN